MIKAGVSLLAVTLTVSSTDALALNRYGPGVTDAEIKIGQTMPYSGPASAYATQGKASAAYFQKINAEGGINGRRINFISLDDGYSPPKTVEQVRKLVEQEQVLAIFGSLGTPTNTAVHRYLNSNKVPQLFIASGASKWGDPRNYPWTMGFGPSFRMEGRIYGKYIKKNHPQARIAVLYQNDDYGKDYLSGLRQGLGGGGPIGIELRAPSRAQDERFRQWWARFLRMSASPAAGAALMRMAGQIDIRHILPVIRVPTLILHSVNDRSLEVGGSRYMAEHIAGAKLVELSGIDHSPYLSDADVILDEIEEFLTGERRGPQPDRVLATILFTDIVGATEKAVSLGDSRWRELLDAHHAVVRRKLTDFRGREIDTAGDGFLAAFDGPARAIRCARAISDSVSSLGITVRAGLHTGECELMGDKLGGIAVHIGARIAALAPSGEVLVSSTVKDLVAGSGLSFQDRGIHALKGVPGDWRLFVVEREANA